MSRLKRILFFGKIFSFDLDEKQHKTFFVILIFLWLSALPAVWNVLISRYLLVSCSDDSKCYRDCLLCCSVLLQCDKAPGHVSMCLSMSTMTDKCPDHFSLCFSLKSRYTQYKFLDLPLNPSLIVSILRFFPRHMPSNLTMLTCSSQCCECCRVRPVWCPHSLETAVTALAQPHQCHWLPSSWHGHCSCSPLQSTLSRSQTTTSTTLQHCSSNNTTTKGANSNKPSNCLTAGYLFKLLISAPAAACVLADQLSLLKADEKKTKLYAAVFARAVVAVADVVVVVVVLMLLKGSVSM